MQSPSPFAVPLCSSAVLRASGHRAFPVVATSTMSGPVYCETTLDGAAKGDGKSAREMADGIVAPTTPPDRLRSPDPHVAVSAGAGGGSAGAGEGEPPAATRAADGPMRTCRECSAQQHWRKMKGHFIEKYTEGAEDRAGTAAERDDVREGRQKNWYEYTCEDCWARISGMSVEEARRDIKGARSAKAMDRARTYAVPPGAAKGDGIEGEGLPRCGRGGVGHHAALPRCGTRFCGRFSVSGERSPLSLALVVAAATTPTTAQPCAAAARSPSVGAANVLRCAAAARGHGRLVVHHREPPGGPCRNVIVIMAGSAPRGVAFAEFGLGGHHMFFSCVVFLLPQMTHASRDV